MSNLTTRLSKAVWEYLDTATLRQEPFSLSRIEEVIAGVMATDSKPVVGIDFAKLGTDKTVYFGGRGGGKSWHEQMWDQAEAARKRQADAERAALEQYWAKPQEPTSPVTYDLSADPDAFKKAKVGDVVECSGRYMRVLGSGAQEFLNKSVEGFELRFPSNRDAYRWTRTRS